MRIPSRAFDAADQVAPRMLAAFVPWPRARRFNTMGVFTRARLLASVELQRQHPETPMTAARRSRYLVVALSIAALASVASPVLSQALPSRTPSADQLAVPDDMMTLVVGTRFVAPSGNNASARALFTGSRIPLTAFNETDNCIDQQALELAKEYFTTLGRVLGRAGHYYYLPDDEIRKSAVMCERLHHKPPRAWVGNGTKIISFGQVVPTTDAPALEESIR